MQFNISKGELKRALNGVKGCAANNEARLNLKGVNIRNEGPAILFQATDGHRMARYTTAPLEMLSGKDDFLITPDQVKTVLTACKGKAGDVLTISTDPRGLWTLDGAGKTISFNPPEVGKFPNLDQVIPQAFEYGIEFEPAELTAACKAVALVSDEKIKPMAFHFHAGTVSLESERAESGDVDWLMGFAKGSMPESGRYGVNAAYVLKMLAALKGGDVGMQFNGPLQPLQFTAGDMPGLTYIIMPLRIEWGDQVKPEPVKPIIVTAADTLADDLETWTDQDNADWRASKREPEPGVSGPGEPAFATAHIPKPEGGYGSGFKNAEPEPVAAPATLTIEPYSDRAFIIRGGTYQDHYLRIKFVHPKAHGVWHRGAGGWLFSKKWELEIRAALADVLAA